MTLLVLSDSHGRPDLIEEVIRRARPDRILFAVDGLRDLTRLDIPVPLWAVSGNCDWLSSPLIIQGQDWEPAAEELITVEGIRILVMHGHKYSVKSGHTRAVYRAMELGADVLVFGHTHIPYEGYDSDGGFYLFNPGSISDSYSGKSYGIITVTERDILTSHGRIS